MSRLALLAFVLCAASAGAQTTSTSTSSTTTTLAPPSTKEAGTITTAQVVSGAGNGSVCVKGHAASLVIDMTGASTPSASFLVEHTTASTWAVVTTPAFVAMTPIALSTSTTGASVAIINPVGCYRTNITTYATGTFTATYQMQLSP